MSLRGKIAAGIVLAALPLLAVIALLVSRLDEIARSSHEVVTVQVDGAGHATEIRWRTDPLETATAKYLVSGDADYLAQADEQAEHIDVEIAALRRLRLAGEERAAFDALAAAWSVYRNGAGARLRAERDPDGPDEVGPALDEVRRRSAELDRTARAAMLDKARTAAARSAEAAQLSTAVAIAASVVSLLVFVLTFRSIAGPLAALRAGTRRVAAGDLEARIGERGGGELGQLAQAFDAMVAQLAQLERAKSTFVSHVSHELRTPLVGIVETNELLLDEVIAPLHPKQRRMLELNQASARRLSSMIGELLELSTLSAGLRYTFARRDLGAVVQHATSAMEARFAQAGVALRVEPASAPIVAMIDGDRVQQVVSNLVDNALKVTTAGGEVAVRIDAVRDPSLPETIRGRPNRSTQGKVARVVVEDTGPGLDDDDPQALFDRFARGKHGARGSGAGFGLGLAICREIVDAHDGVVFATSREDRRGARFTVLIPLAPDASVPLGRAGAATAALAIAMLGSIGCASSPPPVAPAGQIELTRALSSLAADPLDTAGRAHAELQNVVRAAPTSRAAAEARVLLAVLDARSGPEAAVAAKTAELEGARADLQQAKQRAEMLEVDLDAASAELTSAGDERRRLAGEMQELRARVEDLSSEVGKLRRELSALKQIDLRKRR